MTTIDRVNTFKKREARHLRNMPTTSAAAPLLDDPERQAKRLRALAGGWHAERNPEVAAWLNALADEIADLPPF